MAKVPGFAKAFAGRWRIVPGITNRYCSLILRDGRFAASSG